MTVLLFFVCHLMKVKTCKNLKNTEIVSCIKSVAVVVLIWIFFNSRSTLEVVEVVPETSSLSGVHPFQG